MTSLPRVVTHTYDPARAIAKNLCDLPRDQAERLLDEIRTSGKRRIKADYLDRRLAVEDWLIAERSRKLGRTALLRPVYFFLGDFADGLDAARPASLLMPLELFPPDALTFTYPDSMASLPIARQQDHARYRKAYHGQVFTLSEIVEVVRTFGLPGDRWRLDPAMTYDRFIEVQVWDDAPIRAFLASDLSAQRATLSSFRANPAL